MMDVRLEARHTCSSKSPLSQNLPKVTLLLLLQPICRGSEINAISLWATWLRRLLQPHGTLSYGSIDAIDDRQQVRSKIHWFCFNPWPLLCVKSIAVCKESISRLPPALCCVLGWQRPDSRHKEQLVAAKQLPHMPNSCFLHAKLAPLTANLSFCWLIVCCFRNNCFTLTLAVR